MISLCKTGRASQTRRSPPLQNFKSYTAPRISANISELAYITKQTGPRFQTKTNLEGHKSAKAEASSPMLFVKDFVESAQFLTPIQKMILGRR